MNTTRVGRAAVIAATGALVIASVGLGATVLARSDGTDANASSLISSHASAAPSDEFLNQMFGVRDAEETTGSETSGEPGDPNETARRSPAPHPGATVAISTVAGASATPEALDAEDANEGPDEDAAEHRDTEHNGAVSAVRTPEPTETPEASTGVAGSDGHDGNDATGGDGHGGDNGQGGDN